MPVGEREDLGLMIMEIELNELAAKVFPRSFDTQWQHDADRGGQNMPMTFGLFSQANRDRCESPQGFTHPLSGWSASDWMTALTGEVGEAANVVKKLNRVRDGVPGNKVSEEELRAQLRRELGDVFVYLDLFAQSLGFSIADAAAEVFNKKSAEIGYPKTL